MGIKLFTSFFLFFLFVSCKEKTTNVLEPPKANKVVLIAVNAPKKYIHFIEQDSIGKEVKDSLGIRIYFQNNGFTYLNAMDEIQTWLPKPNVSDTITIETYKEYLELSTPNFFTGIKTTFLVQNGDTVLFTYADNIPKAKIINRKVNEIEVNYNSYRHQKLFDNKYSSHFLVSGNLWFLDNPMDYEFTSIEYYKQAKQDYFQELKLLDSLRNAGSLSEVNYLYRKDALNMLMEKHKNQKNIHLWVDQDKESIEQAFDFDWKQTDSLMTFSFFRDYLIYNSQYDLNFIEENNEGSGGFYVDSRIRFDSILGDNRFHQTAKNFLLFDAYTGIVQNFGVKDKEYYFEKLQANTTNLHQLRTLVKAYKLDFSTSKELILTNAKNDTLEYKRLLEQNRGKWLYIDFWASWCLPCRKTMPESNKLRKDLAEKNIEFIYLSLNDRKENWKTAVQSDGISDGQNYFIENGNISKVIEDLGIKSIPHFLIYNPNGELINGFANRPGQGAKEQLQALLTEN